MHCPGGGQWDIIPGWRANASLAVSRREMSYRHHYPLKTTVAVRNYISWIGFKPRLFHKTKKASSLKKSYFGQTYVCCERGNYISISYHICNTASLTITGTRVLGFHQQCNKISINIQRQIGRCPIMHRSLLRRPLMSASTESFLPHYYKSTDNSIIIFTYGLCEAKLELNTNCLIRNRLIS